MRILGISAYYHDAAALVVDGRIEYAAQEERFTRVKHDPGFPHEATRSCLAATGVRPAEIDVVNTSFNVRGERIVCTPEDAFRCFMGTEIEVLAVGNCYLRKEDQNLALRKNYESNFAPD